jgi:MFS family permease
MGATIGIQAGASFAVIAIPMLAPVIGPAAGVPVEWVGMQTSLVYLTSMIGSFGAGSFLQRFGPARTSQVALLACALGLLLITTGIIGWLIAASALIGAGYSLTNPAASQVLQRTVMGSRRNLVFSMKQTSVPLGGAIAGGFLPTAAAFLGWQAALFIGAAVLASAAGLLQKLRPSWDGTSSSYSRSESQRAPGRWTDGLVIVWHSQPLRTIALTGFAFSTTQWTLGSYATVMLVTEFGWALIPAGIMASAIQVSGVIGRPLFGLVADNNGSAFRTLALLGVLTAIFSLALFVMGQASPALTILILVALGTTCLGWNGIVLAEAARHSPVGSAGTVAAAILACTFAGVVIGPTSFALLTSYSGTYSGAFVWLAGFPLLVSVLLSTQRRPASVLPGDD